MYINYLITLIEKIKCVSKFGYFLPLALDPTLPRHAAFMRNLSQEMDQAFQNAANEGKLELEKVMERRNGNLLELFHDLAL